MAFCEIEEFPRKVLAKHWPEVPCYHDVTKLTGDILRQDRIAVDVITGGFPCQDISVAGKQAGIKDGTRSGLWSEIVRLIGELSPQYVIVENVANLLSGPPEQRGGWFGRILGDLAECGYDAEWHNIPASHVGAWHKRARIWVLAYPNQKRCEGRAGKPVLSQRSVSRQLVRGFEEWAGRPNLSASRFCNADDGIPNRVVRTEAAGNAVVPQIPEMIGHAILASMLNSEE